MHSKTKNWRKELKNFPIPLSDWSLQGEEFYDTTYVAHLEFEKTGNEEEWTRTVNRFFYLPLHALILKRAATDQLQQFLRTVYTGPDTTLLEKITEALYEYHIIKGGKRTPPEITLTQSQLKCLGTDVAHFRSVLEELSTALDPIITVQFESQETSGRFTELDITVFLPRTDCDMDFVQEREMLA